LPDTVGFDDNRPKTEEGLENGEFQSHNNNTEIEVYTQQLHESKP